MLIEKHLLSNKTNADSQRMWKGSHMATRIPVPGHVHSGMSSADRGDTERLTDQHLINQTESAPLGAPSL